MRGAAPSTTTSGARLARFDNHGNQHRQRWVDSDMRRILIATDFSKASANAFATAVALAKAHKGTLTILHVIAPYRPIMPEQYSGTQTWDQIDLQGREWAKEELAKLAAKAKKRESEALNCSSTANPLTKLFAPLEPRKLTS
jgi:hypothetical protein